MPCQLNALLPKKYFLSIPSLVCNGKHFFDILLPFSPLLHACQLGIDLNMQIGLVTKWQSAIYNLWKTSSDILHFKNSIHRFHSKDKLNASPVINSLKVSMQNGSGMTLQFTPYHLITRCFSSHSSLFVSDSLSTILHTSKVRLGRDVTYLLEETSIFVVYLSVQFVHQFVHLHPTQFAIKLLNFFLPQDCIIEILFSQ